jgi:hypothetical protein
LLIAVFALAMPIGVAVAATPSGTDQYQEQVPGPSGPQDPAVYSKSLAGKSGASNKSVKRAAEQNAKTIAAEPPAQPTTQPPAAVATESSAAKIGPLSQRTAAIFGLVLVAGGGAMLMQTRGPAKPEHAPSRAHPTEPEFHD